MLDRVPKTVARNAVATQTAKAAAATDDRDKRWATKKKKGGKGC